MTKKKCALVLITGDRVDYIDSSIKSCLNLINKYNSEIETDIYLICFDGVKVVSNNNIKTLSFDRPTIEADIVLNFPRSIQQVNNYSNDIELTKRISLGHLILFGLVPDTIFKNIDIFSQYDYIIHSHPDVFMLEEEPIVNLLKKNMKTDTAFYISQGLPDDQSFLQTDFFIFKPNLLSINIFKYDINNWNDIGEHYMYYILTKYNIKYELIKRFDNNTWHPRRIDNYKLWHEHDLSLVEAYIQNLEKTSSALSIA